MGVKTYSNLPREQEERHTVRCVLCGSADNRFLYKVSGARFVRCSDCGAVFQNPMPRARHLHERYGSDYFSYELENETAFFTLMKLGLEDVGFSSLECESYDERRFLDIGCATGMLLEDLRDRGGWDVYGVEVCRESAQYGRKKRNLRIFNGTLRQAEFPEETFDVAHASHVIEHIDEPVSFIEEIRRVLKPGGYAIISTPNIGGLQSRIFKEGWRSAIPDHMVLYSKQTLHRLLVRTGFQVCKKKTWGGLAAGVGAPFLKNILDKAAKRFGFGDVMIFLARK